MKAFTRLGIIGMGNMGGNHLRIANMIPNLEVVGGFDLNSQQAERQCRKYHTRHFESLDHLIAASDALIIATSTRSHFDIAKLALQKGRHIFIEKPATATSAEAEALAHLAKQSSLVVQVGHVERFNPVFHELKQVLAVEKPLAFSILRMSPFSQQAADVSVVFDLLIHDLDMLLALAPNVESLAQCQLQAQGMRHHATMLNYVDCQIRFASGLQAHLTASKITHEKLRQFLITCEHCFIVADFLAKSLNIYRHQKSDYLNQPHSTKYQQSSQVERVMVPNEEPLLAEIRSFLHCIGNQTQPEVGIDQAAMLMKWLENIERLALA